MAIRRCERLKDDNWIVCQMSDLDVGDKFRLFEPDGTPVVQLEGHTEWYVIEKPKLDSSGKLIVKSMAIWAV